MIKAISGLCAPLVFALLAASANAEICRWVDPATGKTMVSDTAPPSSVKNASCTRARHTAEEGSEQQSSFEMREAARKFPVVLYTSPDSEFSAQARSFLEKRGIPFRENIIQTEDDRTAMKNLTGDTKVPALYVGRSIVRGFDSDAFNRALDVAGYPKEKQRPETKNEEKQ